MADTAHTRRTRPGGSRRALWRLNADGHHARGYRPTGDSEPDDFELCLALLDEAIARAERWYAHRERALVELDRRGVDAVRRLRAADAIGLSITWDTTITQ